MYVKLAVNIALTFDIFILIYLLVCFSLQRQNQEISTFTEVSKEPKGQEWLWHPQVVKLYNLVLQRCDVNSVTREAAAGALQNITAGDKRVSYAYSG